MSTLRTILLLSVFAGCIWSGLSPAATTINFAGVLPNGALLPAPVESMHAGRFRNIVRQQTDFSCGASALATLLRYGYGIRVDESTVIAGMMAIADHDAVRKNGFSMLDIKRYIETLGLRGRGYRISEARLRNLRVPTLILIDTKGYRHFVVLKRIEGDTAEIADPMLGNRSMPVAELMHAWPSRALFAVIGNGFDRNTVLLQPARAPSARSLYSRAGVLTDAELLEFGFTKADLF